MGGCVEYCCCRRDEMEMKAGAAALLRERSGDLRVNARDNERFIVSVNCFVCYHNTTTQVGGISALSRQNQCCSGPRDEVGGEEG